MMRSEVLRRDDPTFVIKKGGDNREGNISF